MPGRPGTSIYNLGKRVEKARGWHAAAFSWLPLLPRHVCLQLECVLVHDAMPTLMQTRFATLFFKAIPGAVLGILLGTRAALATDWPQFRGPNRDGNWDETGILESFPSAGLKIGGRHPVGGGGSRPGVVSGQGFGFCG